ncbi:lipoyl(octanoyl) transferase LipB [uncultured Sneathiella sp.]|jgi:lipoyl(octanoyl) transferase|uniref:lipoyl(octanoyl) transferase LipB n=1 Tax=uncultured Sneathiella sp. TaxID=879315 RepID=UPI0030DB8322|tara:strand:+ start:439 stop:1128 length:690 start_codon:yes stop_codon:yes gene_type:complete
MQQIEWKISDEPVAYEFALAEMEQRVAAIHEGSARELVWLLEHPPLYTAGTSANLSDLRDPDRFPVHKAGRGGQYTYHGPGQRVAYVMLDLKKRNADIRAFVQDLEDWVVDVLAQYQVKGEKREGRVGVWVDRGFREDKIAAIGVRVRRWISFHGISINVDPDLSHYEGIVPCGIAEHGVTSLVDLGIPVSMAEFDVELKASFNKIFLKDGDLGLLIPEAAPPPIRIPG